MVQICPMPDTNGLPALLTAAEVAQALRVTTSSVYRWADDGTLKSIRVGETVRFRRDDVVALLEAAS